MTAHHLLRCPPSPDSGREIAMCSGLYQALIDVQQASIHTELCLKEAFFDLM